jgi:hypothetical protein
MSFKFRAMNKAVRIPDDLLVTAAPARRGALCPVHPWLLVFICIAAFAVYWSSSFVLNTEARDGRMHFGADTLDFAPLANGEVSNRNLRLHPLTIGLSLGWMKVTQPLAGWLEPEQLHRALFALIGALGVWAAICAFAALVPRRYVALLGIIYAGSLGIWYFASIEESKILAATLSSLYIAVYFHIRKHLSARNIALLSAVLLAACLNEIVAAFLVAIPATDSLLRHRFDLRKSSWIFVHALVPVAALLFLEFFINGVVAQTSGNPENASHFSMFFYYLVRDHYFAAVYIYIINWFFFSIAAPAPEAEYLFEKWPLHPYYFEPSISNYVSFLPQAAVAIVFLAIAFGAALALWRRALSTDASICLAALSSYALVRCVFFYFIHPLEGLLFSSSVVLAHLLLLAVPFAASPLPGKRLLLAVFAVLLIVANGIFITGIAV